MDEFLWPKLVCCDVIEQFIISKLSLFELLNNSHNHNRRQRKEGSDWLVVLIVLNVHTRYL